ncbi:MAG: hypothetical protein ACRC62_34615 [Microcoleus sp.]
MRVLVIGNGELVMGHRASGIGLMTDDRSTIDNEQLTMDNYLN